jgi:putative ABC transport system ATP-binding protein
VGTGEIVKLSGVSKTYNMDDVEVNALDNISLTLNAGEFVVLSGPSGSGKSTLLNLIGCIDKPSSGSIYFENKDITQVSLEDLNDLRLKKLGFIYQAFNLIPVLTAYENIEIPLVFKTSDQAYIKSRINKILAQVGLSDRASHRPNKLSGGQRQRVAIARALAGEPILVIADEPTASLDSKTSTAILDLMVELNRNNNVTMIIASHDPLVVERAGRKINMRDGRIVE